MSEEATPEHSFRETVEQIARLRLTGPWPRLRGLFHDDARPESIASGGISGPDETVNAMRLAAGDGVYKMGEWRIEHVEPDVMLLASTMRHLATVRPGRTGMIDASDVWLMVGRGGLLWRMRIFRTRESALEHLRTHGETLGL